MNLNTFTRKKEAYSVPFGFIKIHARELIFAEFSLAFSVPISCIFDGKFGWRAEILSLNS